MSINATAIIDSATDWSTGVVQKHRDEIVSGYVLEQQIGAGAYGEVWRATGPGGLPKAVKILHGKYDGPQADTEMRSLERMRGLQHPFLLNIERIEIVDGRLVIVTELADESLEARFNQLRSDGYRGIPRDELIGYMRDAADALDFLWERHGLQHLDVKPGNLLLQGDHLKVADFGLIKDVRQTSVSLVGGFTPLYAPPELFEGRPSRNSDQYSLAIVYQMMLTGVPPFAGRTAAQLTAQHMHSQPDLKALPLSDRPAVMRALSKNPDARFASCCQLVDRLSSRKSNEGKKRGGTEEPRQLSAKSHGTAAAPSARLHSDTTKVRRESCRLEPRPLAPVNADPSQVTYRPTIFLGIGGLGSHVLRSLRRRFTERFGDASALAALPLLYIDTDARAISAGRAMDDPFRFEHDETLLIPLREPTAYRSDSQTHLQWLSRRWLFNIPKSRKVEGIRPLGRLAFADHHQAIRSRIGQMIDDVTSEDALQQTYHTTGLRFAAGPPDVVLVAAISGGTGSGSVLDVAYLIRDLLAERGSEPGDFSGLLLHATSPQLQTRELETANAVACLRELEHFISPEGGYPGDPACQLPRFDVSPFDHTYVVHLGDDQKPASLATEADKIAEYLYRSTATSARAFFQACRLEEEMETGPKGQVAGLRTFGVAKLGEDFQAEAADEGVALCRALVRRWRGHLANSPEGRPATTTELPQRTSALLSRLRLSAEDVGDLATSMTQGTLGKRIETYFHGRWAQLHTQNARDTHATGSLTDVFDGDFLPECREMNHADHPAAILRHLQQHLHTSAQKCVLAIQTDLLALIDTHAARLDACREALGDVVFRLDATLERLLPLLKRIGGDLERIKLSATHDMSASSEPNASPTHQAAATSTESRAFYQRYYLLKFYEGIWRCTVEYVRTIRDTVSKTAVAFASLDSHMQRLEDSFRRAPSETRTKEQPDIPSAIPAPAESVVQAFDHELRTEGKVRLVDLISPEFDSTAQAFVGAIRNEAFAFLAERDGGQNADPTATGKTIDQEKVLVEAVTPRISSAGGGRRILAVLPGRVPPTACQQELTKKFGNCVTIQQHACRDLFACCEVEGLAVHSIVERLTYDQPALIDMAIRLHTRVDVEWNPG